MTPRLTPVDILNLRFPRRVSGYGIAEVDEFVRRVAGDLEAVVTDCAAQREKIAALEREIGQYRTLEATMRDALIMAQKAADETRAAARSQATAIQEEAQNRAEEMNVNLERLRQERRRMAREMRAQLTAQLTWLDQEMQNEPPPAVVMENPTVQAVLPTPESYSLAANGIPNPSHPEDA